jgi:RNA polymerase sigma-70 factor (ECF subfamily)
MRTIQNTIILAILFLSVSINAQYRSFKVDVSGKGNPVLLFPGFTCTGEVWKDLVKEIYHSNYENVMRLCLGYLGGDKDEADDLTQEVFIKVWDNLNGFGAESKVSTWIYRITVNTCLARIRKSKRSISADNIGDIGEIAQPSTIDRERMFKSLYKCINGLSETNRAIILLELEGLPQKEIAEIIGLRHEAIRTRIHRIKNELTKCVNHE